MKLRPLLHLLALFGLAGTAWAGTWWRAVASETQPLLIEQLIANESDTPLASTPAREQTVLVVATGQTRRVTATLVGEPATTPVAPGGFVKYVYQVTAANLPTDGYTLLIGTEPVVVTAVNRTKASTLASQVPTPATDKTDSSATTPAVVPPATEGDTSASNPVPAVVAHNRLGLHPHEPVYFSVGANKGLNARFQLSFKFRPTGPENPDDDGSLFTDQFYFAFTQTSLWDWNATSKPFRDSSYRPAIFYQRIHAGEFLGADFGYAAGVEHESNGRDGLNSRSINIAYVTPTLRWNFGRTSRLTLAAKTYYYLDKVENDDIDEYRGFCDFIVGWEKFDGLKIEAKIRKGTVGQNGSLQIDASYPFSSILHYRNFILRHGYFHAQYFNGWGETILDYNKRLPWQWRFGVMIVR